MKFKVKQPVFDASGRIHNAGKVVDGAECGWAESTIKHYVLTDRIVAVEDAPASKMAAAAPNKLAKETKARG